MIREVEQAEGSRLPAEEEDSFERPGKYRTHEAAAVVADPGDAGSTADYHLFQVHSYFILETESKEGAKSTNTKFSRVLD